jgi:hypothetical protein
MNKFKIGDKVRVRRDLLVDTFYDDGCKFTSDMENTLGKVGTIVNNVGLIRYMVKFGSDNCYHSYCYSKSMLEPINDEKFKVGDRVRVRRDLLVDTFYDDGCKFISDMEYALGEVGVIVRIERNGRYVIKFDCEDYYHGYCYSPSMLEPITNNNEMEIYRMGDKCPYDFINKFWDDFMNRIWAKMVIINNPEVIVIDENFNIFKARCHRSDVFNPEIGLEICCKKKSMDELKDEKEKITKELTLIENTIKNLKEDLGKY